MRRSERKGAALWWLRLGSVWIGGALLLHNAAAAPPEVEVLMGAYRAEVEESALEPYRAALEELRAKYLAAVERALEAAQGAGQLELALALRTERDAVAGGGSPGASEEEGAPDPLVGLRRTYERERVRLTEERDQQVARVSRARGGSFEELVARFTREGRLEEALAARNALEQVLEEARASEAALASRAAAPEPEPDSAPVMAERGSPAQVSPPRDAVRYKRSRYKVYLVDEPVTWEEARERCREVGGELGWLDSPDDASLIVDFMREVVAEKGHAPIWVGGRRGEGGEWEWVNGEKVDPGFWQDASDAKAGAASAVMVRWIGSFRPSSPDAARVVGYLCRWE